MSEELEESYMNQGILSEYGPSEKSEEINSFIEDYGITNPSPFDEPIFRKR